MLPVVDQLEGVSIEGGSNQLTSGGVRVDTSDTSSLVSSEFRTRNLRSVNSSLHFHNHAKLHEGAPEEDGSDRWRGGGSTFFGPLNEHQAGRYNGETRQLLKKKILFRKCLVVGARSFVASFRVSMMAVCCSSSSSSSRGGTLVP